MIDNQMRNVYNRKGNFVITGTGDVFSVNQNGFIQPYMNGNTLMVDMPSRNGTEFSEDLATVMAKSFYPNTDPNTHEVRFIDGNPNNCRASNIRWVKKPQMPVNFEPARSGHEYTYPDIWYAFDFVLADGSIDPANTLYIKGAQKVLSLCPFNTMTTLNKRIRERQPIEGRGGTLEGYIPRRATMQEIAMLEEGEPIEKIKPFDTNPRPAGGIICDERSTISS